MKYRIRSLSPRGGYPMKVKDYQNGFDSTVMTNKYFNDLEFFQNIHESFIQQGNNYFISSPDEYFSKESAHHRTIVNHSLVVYLNPQKTIIDSNLEHYRPERFDIELDID
jgi:hypothetical protein